MKKIIYSLVAILLCSTVSFSQTNIYVWDFNGASTSDATTNVTIDNSPSSVPPTVGLIGGTSATFATGNGSSDPAMTPPDYGWNTSTYPAATASNQTAGIEIKVDMRAYAGISVQWDQRHSNTASRWVAFQYSSDGGATFTTLPSLYEASSGGDTWYNNRTADLSTITALNNNQNVVFRIVASFPSGGSSYVPSTTTSTYGSSGTMRFDMIEVRANSSLPVRLLSFKSEATQQGVNLSWQTSEEINNSHFEIERSRDAQSFEAIGRMSGRGTTNETNSYTHSDLTPYLGMNYYRLKQVDFDGKFEYSRVIAAQYDGNGTFRAYPNPTTAQLTIELPKDSEATGFELLDTQGRQVRKFNKQEDVSLGEMPTGTYFLRVKMTDGTLLKQRIFKY